MSRGTAAFPSLPGAAFHARADLISSTGREVAASWTHSTWNAALTLVDTSRPLLPFTMLLLIRVPIDELDLAPDS